MREILFRGKPVNKAFGDNFIYGSLGVIREGLTAIYDCLEFTEDIRHFVIPETVGQYTGLIDKNGNKIFEGDIVSISGELKGDYICVWEEHNFEYEFDNKTTSFGLACVHSDDIEVIGNIHDKPELLKGEVTNNGI